MSYCVNCGVELDNTAKKCVLCNTPVVNPNIPKDADTGAEKPFSEKIMIPKAVKKSFIAFAVSIIMLIPNIVMFVMNVFFVRDSFWSLYVFAASLLLWVVFVLPFFMKKIRIYILWAFDTFAASAFSFVSVGLHGSMQNIYLSIQSVILLVSLAVLFFIVWFRCKKRHWTAVTFVLLLESTLVSFFSGVAVASLTGNYNFFIAGSVIAVCTLVLTVFFIYCNRSCHVRAWLNKAFYL